MDKAITAGTHIIIKGAREHNLKNIDVAIPKNKLVVITGLSGSGKSSLAFDTLYAEGQRRYVESLSSYARQFMGRMNKPDVDFIKGIAPAIAIEQKVIASNPRSTVGTSTEIYDYLKLLFARIGKTYSPVSGQVVKKHSVSDVVDFMVSGAGEDRDFTVLCPLYPHNKRTLKEELAVLLQKGFRRVRYKEKMVKIESLLEDSTIINSQVKDAGEVQIVIDRVLMESPDEETLNRLSDSVQTAFFEGKGDCLVIDSHGKMHHFCDRFELDGMRFEEPTPQFFSFNSPYGACTTCEGYGKVIGIDEDLVIPDKSRSVYDEAVAPWRGEKMKEWRTEFIRKTRELDFPIHRAYYELDAAHKELLWKGKGSIKGIDAFFRNLEEQTYKIQYRVMLSRYRGKTACPDCRGTRLRKDAAYVKINGTSIIELVLMPVDRLLAFFDEFKPAEFEEKVAKRLLVEIRNRLRYLTDVGLGYLTLNRLSNTLSGGESQRINLATSLGSSLVGSLYVLDEPSIGLHPRDTQRLISVLQSLRNAGNTVIVVEHEEEIIRAANHIIDIGPYAGTHGGQLMFDGDFDELLNKGESLTALYLQGREEMPLPASRRKWSDHIEIKGARENNLKHIDVKFPLHVLTVITGVSGSGKTSLVKQILCPALVKATGGYAAGHTGAFDMLGGDLSKIKQVELVDQNPIGRSSRSNPATYVKAYDDIRQLFASRPAARAAGLKPAHFSFNVDGGRCETCQGEGEQKIEMQFMADIYLTCETCKGKRFKEHVLEVKYEEKDIAEVLDLTIDEALEFFAGEKKIINKIQPLADVGLGYVKLGQSSNTLSGGEAQRIKLASFLIKGHHPHHTLFVFDEPTTGLHFHDIKKLLESINALIDQGNTVIIIEHNMDVIKSADWVIDLGPEGGEKGGELLYEGTPEGLTNVERSYTGQFLKRHIHTGNSR
ncbi:excinuclease ABC subunit A [Anseongella ginsenosidimutans]|uniref:UvrABC system protein A n=1 Tax=Anseongella ginsenosidimutans TaxID=496056 RepID=A0A4R3KQK6_9SPHI|nr:excinuclease ABC subunit UvrA [Anseongella ginsenosidimutans]QEC52582.1 excinuclease ABC subunit A [Anseongella ginsenosidimutans]TCS86499.1 excinuclease ABC subunit A [Anseongella ginsenosidimutans]